MAQKPESEVRCTSEKSYQMEVNLEVDLVHSEFIGKQCRCRRNYVKIFVNSLKKYPNLKVSLSFVI